MIEVGLESFRVQHGDVRWWFFIHLEGEKARPQRSRLGVADPGFRFARGGVAESADEARAELARSRVEAEAEWARWQHQPSHALGTHGELIPLGQVLPELIA